MLNIQGTKNKILSVCITIERTEIGNIFSSRRESLNMFYACCIDILIYIIYFIYSKKKVKPLLFANAFLWLEKSIHFTYQNVSLFILCVQYNSTYIKGMDQHDLSRIDL